MGKSTEILKYISVFTLADIRNVIVNESINIVMIIISLLLTTTLLYVSIKKYEKKELI